MHIVIPDDYQDCVRELDAFAKLAGHRVTIYNDTVSEEDALVERFQDADALVLIRERTPITASLLARLPKLKLISQTGGGAAHVDMAACREHGVVVLAGTGSPFAAAELTWGAGALGHATHSRRGGKPPGRPLAADPGHWLERAHAGRIWLRQNWSVGRPLRPGVRDERAGMGT